MARSVFSVCRSRLMQTGSRAGRDGVEMRAMQISYKSGGITVSRKTGIAMCGLVVCAAAGAPAWSQDKAPSAKMLNLRFDEDFDYLSGDEGSYEPDRFDFLKNNSLGDDWRFDLGGDFRFRGEWRDNHTAFGTIGGPQNTQQLYRWMMHFNLKYQDSFRFFIQGVVTNAEDQDTGFNPTQENHGDLQQMFIDWNFMGGDSPWYVRVGRQDLLYGAERFVSPLDWANQRRRFDAVKLVYAGDPWHVEGFYAKPVVVQRKGADNYNEEFDFAGLYATYSGFENHGLDLYFFAIDRTQDTVNPNGAVGDQSIYTLGTRFWGTTDAWDYEAELDHQFGSWASDSVSAWSFSGVLGYTFPHACKPRFGIGFDWASGDDESSDTSVGTFNQMFPLGHAFLGYADLVGRQNIIATNINLSAWAVPEKVKATVAYHLFWLANDEDALYNSAGAATVRDATGASGQEVGSEIDFTVNWKMSNHSSMLLGYSHFFDNGFVDTNTARDSDPDFFYLQYEYKF